MAITQVGTTVEQGITYGFSKWCNQLFADGDWKPSELAKYSWCRWRDKYIGCCSTTSTNIQSQQGAAVTQLLSYFNSSLSETSSNYVAYYNDNRIPTKEPYCFNILMYGRNGDQTLTSDCASNYRVITSCSDFQSLYVLVNKYQPAQSTISVNYPTARTVNCNSLRWADNGVYNTNNNAHAQWITVWTVFVIDEDNFFVTRGMAFPGYTPCMYDGVMGSAQNNLRPSNSLSISYGNRITESKWNYSYGDITNYQKTMHLLRWYKNGITGIEPQTWGDSKYGVYDVDDDVAIIMRSGNAVYGNINIRYTYYLKSEEAVKNAIAYTGLRWKYQEGDTTHVYTPIIDGDGYITGYSTDPDAETKLNDIIDVTGNNISPLPPAPPTPSGDDDYADMGIGVGTGVGGYTSFAIMTKDDLVDLLADFNANLEDGMSVVNNFICLYKLGPLASSLCSTRVGNIIMSANASTNFVSIRADYNIVTSQKDVITLGSYDVPRMTNTFYDFAPYSTYELFIPCCGWVPLPDTVAGRQITVYLIIDLSSCTCKGICRIGGTTVAEASGVLGVSVPFFSTDSGIKRAADLMAVTQVISGIAQGAVGAGAGAGALVVSGSANALQGLEQLYINGNTNYTAIKGGNGDITAVGNGEYCTLKIAHPKVDEVVNNSRFGHSVGYLCNTVGKIKEFKGFTVCANPHVNGIDCTDSEKEEIKRLLEEGIIVN